MVICDVACHVMSFDVVVTSLSFDVVFGSQWLFEPTDTGCRFWQKSLLEPTKTKIAIFLTFAKKNKVSDLPFCQQGAGVFGDVHQDLHYMYTYILRFIEILSHATFVVYTWS